MEYWFTSSVSCNDIQPVSSASLGIVLCSYNPQLIQPSYSCLSGQSLHLRLAEIAPRLLEAKRILEIIGCFSAIPTKSPVIFSLLGFDARSVKTLNSKLNQIPPACVVPTFKYDDLYKVLAGPAVNVLDRYDLHSVLQFLRMKLRTALSSTWLHNFPELRQVSPCVVCHHCSFVVPSSFNFWS